MLADCLRAANREQGQCEPRDEMQQVDALHEREHPSGITTAQATAETARTLPVTVQETPKPSTSSHHDVGMARVLVMLPTPTIAELDALRAETRVSRSTQLRILILRAMRTAREGTS